MQRNNIAFADDNFIVWIVLVQMHCVREQAARRSYHFAVEALVCGFLTLLCTPSDADCTQLDIPKVVTVCYIIITSL